MRHRTIFLIVFLTLLIPFVAETEVPRRPVHTFSIVAWDPDTGNLGVAVQSHWFSVGTVVTWGEAGVGVVATQSFADPAYGPRGLDLMRSGLDAPEAMKALLEVDESRAVRQVAFVDSAGRVAAHTGEKCIEYAGHHVGENYSVQANMMHGDRVIAAMANAFEAAEGDLAARLLAALEAGQREKGDIRGKQSAAMLIVKGQSTGRPWADRILELRIEDHQQPIEELSRLLQLHRAYEHMNAGDVAVEKGDLDQARSEYSAAGALAPDNLEVRYWQAVTLATTGFVDEALPLFRRVFAADQRWVELTKRLVKPGLIPESTEGKLLLDQILSQAPGGLNSQQ